MWLAFSIRMALLKVISIMKILEKFVNCDFQLAKATKIGQSLAKFIYELQNQTRPNRREDEEFNVFFVVLHGCYYYPEHFQKLVFLCTFKIFLGLDKIFGLFNERTKNTHFVKKKNLKYMQNKKSKITKFQSFYSVKFIRLLQQISVFFRGLLSYRLRQLRCLRRCILP